MQLPKLKDINAIKNYILHVSFTDGTQGSYDLSHLAGKGVFKSWDTNNNFFKVFIHPESGAISWPGEIDIDTIQVYCSVKGIKTNEYLTKEQHATH